MVVDLWRPKLKSSVCSEVFWGLNCYIYLELLLSFVILLIASFTVGLILQHYKMPHYLFITVFATIQAYLLQFATVLSPNWLDILIIFIVSFIGYITAYLLFNRWQSRLKYKFIVAAAILVFTLAVIIPGVLLVQQHYQLMNLVR